MRPSGLQHDNGVPLLHSGIEKVKGTGHEEEVMVTLPLWAAECVLKEVLELRDIKRRALSLKRGPNRKTANYIATGEM